MRGYKDIALIGLAVCLALLGACGGSNGVTKVAPEWNSRSEISAPVAALDSPNRERDISGFSIEPAIGAELPQLKLAIGEPGSQVIVEVVSAARQSLAEVIAELHYDAAQYTPLAAQATDAIAPLAESLCMQMLDTPGVVSLGQVALDGQARQVQAGVVLAEVLFFCEPLDAASAKSASQVPVHKGALSPLLWDEDNGEFSWYYVNPGDYNQNGLTDISDISPLGREFGQAGPFAFTAARSVIDGNSDGLIGIADLSTIGQYWGSRVEGYNLYASDDITDVPAGFADTSLLDPVASFSLFEAQGDVLLDRLWFSYEPLEEEEGLIFWARPYAAGEEGTRSNICSTDMDSPPIGPDGFNLPPEARLGLTYTGTSVPLTVTFDATASLDPDGTIIFYEWDFQGDGLFDAFSTGAVAQHTYIQPGTYSPLVRVTDNGGLWDTFQSPSFDVTESTVSNIPPVADLIATLTEGQAPLTVGLIAAGSFDPDGHIVKYEWDFDGDGEFDLDSGADPTVLHVYVANGVFNVIVRATDDRDASDTDTLSVIVQPSPDQTEAPLAEIIADKQYGDEPLAVSFDASGSSDPDGQIVLFEWDFNGDGQYENYGETGYASHVYAKAGVYAATVRVTDDVGAQMTASTDVRVNEALDLVSAWPGFGHDPRHTGRSPYVGAQSNAIRWSYSADNGLLSSPAIGADGTVFFSDYHHLYAVKPDGSLYWRMDKGNGDTAPVICDDGSICYVASNALCACNADGSPKWCIPLSSNVYSSPCIDVDGIVYVGTNAGKLHAFNPDGTEKWTYTTEGLIRSTPAVDADGNVYVGTTNDDLLAINPDGTEKWSYHLGQADSSPAIGPDGTIYIGSGNYRLYAINPDGSLKWYFHADRAISSSPAIGADGTIYVGTEGGRLYAISPNGTQAWAYITGGYIKTSPAIGADGIVYFGSSNGLYALSPDGILIWSYTPSSGWSSFMSPAIGADGTIYVGTGDALFAFGSSDIQTQIVDAAEESGGFSSLAVVNSRPAISYYYEDLYSSSLMYIRANNVTGTSWGSCIAVDTVIGSAVGEFTSLAVVNISEIFTGYPAISYYDELCGLKYVRSTDVNGDSWKAPVLLDGGAAVGLYTSLAYLKPSFEEGFPAISYYDETYGDLKYVYSTDPRGDQGWKAPITVDSIGSVGKFTSLAEVRSGYYEYPAISYYDETNGDLKYVLAADEYGDSWDAPVIVDSTGDVGLYTSLAVIQVGYDKLPAISYVDKTNNELKFVLANNEAGDSWNSPITVDSAYDSIRFTALALVNGKPAISYQSGYPLELRYISATTEDGSSWGMPVILDSVSKFAPDISLTELNGRPAVSYGARVLYADQTVLKYAY